MSEEKAKGKIEWTADLVEIVKRNRIPHGLLREGSLSVAQAIEEAHKLGAKIEYYGTRGWTVAAGSPAWYATDTYRVAASWTPPAPEPEAERCEVHHSDHTSRRLHYHRAGDWDFLHAAVNDPDFIAYEYGDGTLGDAPRCLSVSSDLAILPFVAGSLVATVPVAVLFRRSR